MLIYRELNLNIFCLIVTMVAIARLLEQKFGCDEVSTFVVNSQKIFKVYRGEGFHNDCR